MLAANSCLEEVHGAERKYLQLQWPATNQPNSIQHRKIVSLIFCRPCIKRLAVSMFHSFIQFVDVCGQYQQPYSRQENVSFSSRYRAKSALTLQRHVYIYISIHTSIHTSLNTHVHRLYKWTKKARTQNPFEHVLVISSHEDCNICRFVTLSNLF